MIVTRQVVLEDGGVLIETYSDENFMIRQDETGNLYDRALDPIAWPRTYTETDIPSEYVEPEETGPSPNDILNIILGGSDD